MTIEEEVYALLSASASVTAIVPAAYIKNKGVYSLKRPYIVHFPVSLDAIHTHTDGLATLKGWGYQASYFTQTAAQLTALRTAMIAAFNASVYPKFFLRGVVNLEDFISTDTPVLGQALNLEAWYE